MRTLNYCLAWCTSDVLLAHIPSSNKLFYPPVINKLLNRLQYLESIMHTLVAAVRQTFRLYLRLSQTTLVKEVWIQLNKLSIIHSWNLCQVETDLFQAMNGANLCVAWCKPVYAWHKIPCLNLCLFNLYIDLFKKRKGMHTMGPHLANLLKSISVCA